MCVAPSLIFFCANQHALCRENPLTLRSQPQSFPQPHAPTQKRLLSAGASLSPEAVRRAFEYSAATRTPCVAFLGDDCSTLQLAPELVELHETYYEPLAR